MGEESSEYVLTIKAGKAEAHYWADLWRYRELFFFLSWRDILVRYKQTAIGVAWSVIRPLLTMIVFTVVFGRIAGLPSDGAPYSIMVFVAVLPWQFFANSISDSGSSLIGNASMISKIYFPRIIIPASTIIVSLVDFAISFALMLAWMAFAGFAPSPCIFAMPVFLILAAAFSLGSGLFLSALTVKYRDFKTVVPFLVQFGLFISPVGFKSTVIPEKWRALYYLNPMAGVIDGFRWSIIGGSFTINWPGMICSAALTAVVLIVGIKYFRATERTFADVI